MGNWIWKLAGTAAAVAAAGAAVAVADKLLRKQQDKIDAMLRGDTVTYPAQEPETAPETEAAAPQAAQPAPQAETPAEVVYPASVPDDGPNPNPVMAGPAETPRTEDGKIDVSKLCDPADFCDWDDLGCRS